MSWNQVCEPGLRCVMPFEAVPAELRLLRRKVRVTLGGWGATAISDEAELVVTELATNVIKHVGEGAAATLVVEPRRSRLRLEVHDRSHALPSRASAHCDAECGRGLHLLAAMSAECGTLLTATGKAVWCELDLEPLRYGVRVQRAAALIEEYRRMAGTASLVVLTMPRWRNRRPRPSQICSTGSPSRVETRTMCSTGLRPDTSQTSRRRERRTRQIWRIRESSPAVDRECARILLGSSCDMCGDVSYTGMHAPRSCPRCTWDADGPSRRSLMRLGCGAACGGSRLV